MTNASNFNFSSMSSALDFDDFQNIAEEHLKKNTKNENKHRDVFTPLETPASNLSKIASQKLQEIKNLNIRMQSAPPEEITQILAQANSQQAEAISIAKMAAKKLAKAKHELKKAKKYSLEQNNRLEKVSKEAFKKSKPWKIIAKDSRLSENFSKGKFKRLEKSIRRANKTQEDALTGKQNADRQVELALSTLLKAQQTAIDTSDAEKNVFKIAEKIELAGRITENKKL